jgi:hypothetical protein
MEQRITNSIDAVPLCVVLDRKLLAVEVIEVAARVVNAVRLGGGKQLKQALKRAFEVAVCRNEVSQ